MEEESGLLTDRRDHFRVAMAGIGHADAAREVKQFASIIGIDI